MATHPHNTPKGVNEPGLPPHPLLRGPARIPNRLCLEAEFLLLMDLKRRTEERLDEIFAEKYPGATITPASEICGLSPQDIVAGALPKSRLTQAAPGVLLFKGDRRV